MIWLAVLILVCFYCMQLQSVSLSLLFRFISFHPFSFLLFGFSRSHTTRVAREKLARGEGACLFVMVKITL